MAYTKEALLLGSDIDGTLLAGRMADEATKLQANTDLRRLTMDIAHRRNRRQLPFFTGTVTGNTLQAHQMLEQTNGEFGFAVSYMDFAIGSVGAEITVRNKRTAEFELLDDWPTTKGWEGQKAREILLQTTELGLTPQGDEAQSPYKVSMYANTQLGHDDYVKQVGQYLAQAGIAAHVIFSGAKYLDILPVQSDGKPTDKGTALLHCADHLAAREALDARPRIMFAGDSENDIGGFRAAVEAGGFGIVPGNAPEEFRYQVRREFGDSVHLAQAAFAAGVLEGVNHFTRER